MANKINDCYYVKVGSRQFKHSDSIYTENCAEAKKKKRTNLNLNLNFNARVNPIVILFMSICIFLPSGVTSEFLVQTNFAFAQIEFNSTNENAKIESNNSSISSESKSSTLNGVVGAQSSDEVHGDFNGDRFGDIAIGIPQEDVRTTGGTITDAGAVSIVYGTSNGLSATSPLTDQFWTQASSNVADSPEAGDLFGSSLSRGDFNGDGFDDIAIGVPQETVRSTVNMSGAGALNVLYGSSNGLSATSPLPDQFWTQNSANITDSPETHDSFARSLSTGDFNGDGFDDIAIGIPQETVRSTVNMSGAGAVNVLYGSQNGLSATSPLPDQFWTQGTSNVQDSPGKGDFFGSSLSSGDFNDDGFDDIAIGIQFEDLVSNVSTPLIINATGAVNVLYGSSNGLSATSPLPDQFWTQGTSNVLNSPQIDDNFARSLSTGDFNGDGFDDIAIGVPQEDVRTTGGTITDAGAVNVLYGSSDGLSATSPLTNQFWTQATSNVADSPEAGDLFGSSLSRGDFDGDGFDDIGIGVPQESVDTVRSTVNMSGAGALNVLYGSSNGLSATSPHPYQFWTQNSANITDSPEIDDSFARSLSTGDFDGDGFDDIAIGIPQESVDILNSTINMSGGVAANVTVNSTINMSGAGAVNVLYGSSNGLSATSPLPYQFWTQNSLKIEGDPEVNDQFGSALK